MLISESRVRGYRSGSFGLLVMAVGLTACASTSMLSIRRKPDFRSNEIHHVLVIGHFNDQALRKIFEEEFVRQWSRRGIQAVSSLMVLPSSATLTKEVMAPIAKARGFDTVLVTRVLEKKTIRPGEPTVSTVASASQSDLEDMNTALQVLLAPPVSTSEFTLATLETNVYDVVSERRLWSGRSQTEVMRRIPKLIPPFIQLILKHLYESPR
jgi:hypothetical protein